MSWFPRAFEPALRRLMVLVLRKSLGPHLERRIEPEDIVLDVAAGTTTVSDLRVHPERINNALRGVAFKVQAITIQKIVLRLPMSVSASGGSLDAFRDASTILIDGIDVHLEPNPVPSAFSGRPSSKAPARGAKASVSSAGAGRLAGWLESLSASVKAEVRNMRVWVHANDRRMSVRDGPSSRRPLVVMPASSEVVPIGSPALLLFIDSIRLGPLVEEGRAPTLTERVLMVQSLTLSVVTRNRSVEVAALARETLGSAHEDWMKRPDIVSLPVLSILGKKDDDPAIHVELSSSGLKSLQVHATVGRVAMRWSPTTLELAVKCATPLTTPVPVIATEHRNDVASRPPAETEEDPLSKLTEEDFRALDAVLGISKAVPPSAWTRSKHVMESMAMFSALSIGARQPSTVVWREPATEFPSLPVEDLDLDEQLENLEPHSGESHPHSILSASASPDSMFHSQVDPVTVRRRAMQSSVALPSSSHLRAGVPITRQPVEVADSFVSADGASMWAGRSAFQTAPAARASLLRRSNAARSAHKGTSAEMMSDLRQSIALPRSGLFQERIVRGEVAAPPTDESSSWTLSVLVGCSELLIEASKSLVRQPSESRGGWTDTLLPVSVDPEWRTRPLPVAPPTAGTHREGPLDGTPSHQSHDTSRLDEDSESTMSEGGALVPVLTVHCRKLETKISQAGPCLTVSTDVERLTASVDMVAQSHHKATTSSSLLLFGFEPEVEGGNALLLTLSLNPREVPSEGEALASVPRALVHVVLAPLLVNVAQLHLMETVDAFLPRVAEAARHSQMFAAHMLAQAKQVASQVAGAAATAVLDQLDRDLTEDAVATPERELKVQIRERLRAIAQSLVEVSRGAGVSVRPVILLAPEFPGPAITLDCTRLQICASSEPDGPLAGSHAVCVSVHELRAWNSFLRELRKRQPSIFSVGVTASSDAAHAKVSSSEAPSTWVVDASAIAIAAGSCGGDTANWRWDTVLNVKPTSSLVERDSRVVRPRLLLQQKPWLWARGSAMTAEVRAGAMFEEPYRKTEPHEASGYDAFGMLETFNVVLRGRKLEGTTTSVILADENEEEDDRWESEIRRESKTAPRSSLRQQDALVAPEADSVEDAIDRLSVLRRARLGVRVDLAAMDLVLRPASVCSLVAVLSFLQQHGRTAPPEPAAPPARLPARRAPGMMLSIPPGPSVESSPLSSPVAGSTAPATPPAVLVMLEELRAIVAPADKAEAAVAPTLLAVAARCFVGSGLGFQRVWLDISSLAVSFPVVHPRGTTPASRWVPLHNAVGLHRNEVPWIVDDTDVDDDVVRPMVQVRFAKALQEAASEVVMDLRSVVLHLSALLGLQQDSPATCLPFKWWGAFEELAEVMKRTRPLPDARPGTPSSTPSARGVVTLAVPGRTQLPDGLRVFVRCEETVLVLSQSQSFWISQESPDFGRRPLLNDKALVRPGPQVVVMVEDVEVSMARYDHARGDSTQCNRVVVRGISVETSASTLPFGHGVCQSVALQSNLFASRLRHPLPPWGSPPPSGVVAWEEPPVGLFGVLAPLSACLAGWANIHIVPIRSAQALGLQLPQETELFAVESMAPMNIVPLEEIHLGPSERILSVLTQNDRAFADYCERPSIRAVMPDLSMPVAHGMCASITNASVTIGTRSVHSGKHQHVQVDLGRVSVSLCADTLMLLVGLADTYSSIVAGLSSKTPTAARSTTDEAGSHDGDVDDGTRREDRPSTSRVGALVIRKHGTRLLPPPLGWSPGVSGTTVLGMSRTDEEVEPVAEWWKSWEDAPLESPEGELQVGGYLGSASLAASLGVSVSDSHFREDDDPIAMPGQSDSVVLLEALPPEPPVELPEEEEWRTLEDVLEDSQLFEDEEPVARSRVSALDSFATAMGGSVLLGAHSQRVGAVESPDTVPDVEDSDLEEVQVQWFADEAERPPALVTDYFSVPEPTATHRKSSSDRLVRRYCSPELAARSSAIDHEFAHMPDKVHPHLSDSLSVFASEVALSLFLGVDQAPVAPAKRRSGSHSLVLRVANVSMQRELRALSQALPEGDALRAAHEVTALSIGDLSVEDCMKDSPVRWIVSVQEGHPESAQIRLWTSSCRVPPRQRTTESISPNHKVQCVILPVRVVVGPQHLAFLRCFVLTAAWSAALHGRWPSPFPRTKSPPAKAVPDVPVALMHLQEILITVDAHAAGASVAAAIESELAPPHEEALSIVLGVALSPTRTNWPSQAVSSASIPAGRLALPASLKDIASHLQTGRNALSVLSLERVEISLKQVLLPNPDRPDVLPSMSHAVQEAVRMWARDITQRQVSSCLAGISAPLLPVRRVVDAGMDAVRFLQWREPERTARHNLVVLPTPSTVRRTGVNLAMSAGILSRAVVVELLRAAGGAAGALERAIPEEDDGQTVVVAVEAPDESGKVQAVPVAVLRPLRGASRAVKELLRAARLAVSEWGPGPRGRETRRSQERRILFKD
jgi:hypothetical protein